MSNDENQAVLDLLHSEQYQDKTPYQIYASLLDQGIYHCPQFPSRFGSIEDARVFCQNFFGYYNKDHHHSGIGLVTPERFRGKKPQPPALPEAAWINKPKQEKPDLIRT